jgi:tetratricopeptide (TPR) repeat protein
MTTTSGVIGAMVLTAGVVAVYTLATSKSTATTASYATAGSEAAPPTGFLRGAADSTSYDIDRELEGIDRAGASIASETDALDFDDALEKLETLVVKATGDARALDAVRASEHGKDGKALVADAMALLAAGGQWGPVASLLVAREVDAADRTPLIALAAIANSQGFPNVALALLDEAEDLEIRAGSSPEGVSQRAALLNNKGPALALMGRHAEAETALREALALSPELSEAARNLVQVLVRLNKRAEAKALVPRALFRFRAGPATPVPVREETPSAGEEPPSTPGTPPPSESPEQWVERPYLERDDSGRVRLPEWIALDLSRKGQIAWPEIIYPEAGPTYELSSLRASQRYLAANAAAQRRMPRSRRSNP